MLSNLQILRAEFFCKVDSNDCDTILRRFDSVSWCATRTEIQTDGRLSDS